MGFRTCSAHLLGPNHSLVVHDHTHKKLSKAKEFILPVTAVRKSVWNHASAQSLLQVPLSPNSYHPEEYVTGGVKHTFKVSITLCQADKK